MAGGLDTVDEGESEQGGPRHAIGEAQAAVALFKVIVGPGILFLPAGFKNAGLLSGVAISLVVAFVSYWCMVLVLDAAKMLRQRGHDVRDFGDIGLAAFGLPGKLLVDSAVVTSQLGFCTAYCVFVATNLQAVLFEANGGLPETASGSGNCGLTGLLGDRQLVYYMIMVIIPCLIPFTWVRQLRFFWPTNLVANILVVSSLLFIFVGLIDKMARGEGHSLSELALVKPSGALVYFGTAAYAFEGIGVLLPIERVMKRPERFPTVLAGTLFAASACQIVFACCAYVLYGEATSSIITVSLGRSAFLGGITAVEVVQLAWVVEVLLTFPLQLFPAAGILERRCFAERRSGWRWAKNGIRTALLLLCMGVALLGYTSVDNLVALIGALGCLPLAIVYPALFHWRLFFGPAAPEAPGSPAMTQHLLASDVEADGWCGGWCRLPRTDTQEVSTTVPSPTAPSGSSETDGDTGLCSGGSSSSLGELPPAASPAALAAASPPAAAAAVPLPPVPPHGGPLSDLSLVAFGAAGVVLSTALAFSSWASADFHFQVCVLRPEMPS